MGKRLFITFALTGRRCGTYVNPGRCPGLRTCWAFSPRKAARMYRTAKIRLIRTRRLRAARQFVNSFNSLLRRLRPTNELRRSPQPRCKNSINSNPRRERPERAASSQPRAPPWVSVYKPLRPVRAKVWANGWLLLLPLQGVGDGDMVPRALPWARNLLGFQPAQGRR